MGKGGDYEFGTSCFSQIPRCRVLGQRESEQERAGANGSGFHSHCPSYWLCDHLPSLSLV